MTRRRWIAEEFDADHAALGGASAAHLIRVLRVRVGQEFDIATGDVVRRGRVSQISGDRVEFELAEQVGAFPVPDVALFLAVFKFDRMEWVIEKATELGCARILPMIARRTSPALAKAAHKRVERWRRIALEAAQQSRRLTPPEIPAPAPLSVLLAPRENLRIVLAEGHHDIRSEAESSASLARILQAGDAAGGVALAVGPEGGWTEEELHSFAAAGWKAASLGSTVLRTETAALAALAVTISVVLEKRA